MQTKKVFPNYKETQVFSKASGVGRGGAVTFSDLCRDLCIAPDKRCLTLLIQKKTKTG